MGRNGFFGQVDLNSRTVDISFPRALRSLRNMLFHDDMNKAYLSASLKSDREIKETSPSLWLDTAIWPQRQVGFTQCASFWPQMHYS